MRTFFVVFTFIIFSFRTQVLANRIISADLIYRHLGGDKYEFTLTAFRDCSVISFLPSFYYINTYSKSCPGNVAQFRVTQFSKTEVSASCPSKPSYCKGGTSPGFEKYVYKGTYIIPQKCTDWQFYWIECNRPSSINNLQNPGTTCINVVAQLNNKDFSDIDSPVFSTDLTGFVSSGVQNIINLGVQPNGDSLAFSSITPYSGFDITTGTPIQVQYATGFGSSNPLNSNNTFTINNKTGDITFTPSTSATNEKDIVTILVQQYRNHKLVGSVMKDQQIVVFNIPLPSITTSSIPSRVCANTPIRITFGAKDFSGNKTSLTWNNGIPQATFKVQDTSLYSNNQQAVFNWTPTNNDIGQRTFTATVKNDACPLIGQQNFQYSFEVLPSPDIYLRQDTTVLCGKQYPLKANAYNGQPPYVYKWSTGETTDSIYKPYGTYLLTVIDANSCTDVDSVSLKTGLFVDFKITNTSTCAGNTLNFLDLSTTTGNITSWQWDFGDGTSSSAQSPSHLYPTAKYVSVSLTASDNKGCIEKMIKRVGVCSIPTYTIFKGDSCSNQASFSFISNSDICGNTELYIDWGDGSSLLVNTVNGAFGVPNLKLIGFTHQYPNQTTFPFHYQVNSNIKNSGNCLVSKSLTLPVYPKPEWVDSRLSALITEPFNCNYNTITLTGIATTTLTSINSLPPLKYAWSSNVTKIDSNHVTVDSVGIYNLSVTDKRGCFNLATWKITWPIQSQIHVKQGNCSGNDPFVFLDTTFSAWKISARIWDFGDGTTASGKSFSHTFPNTGVYQVTLTDTDSTNCSSSQSITIYNAKPFQRLAKPFLCYDTLYTLLAPGNDSIGDVLVDSLCWQVSRNNTLWYPDDNCMRTHKSDLSLFSPTINFKLPGKNKINVTAYYNYGCAFTFHDSIYVYPKIQTKPTVKDSVCAGKVIEFSASKLISENPITKRTWYINGNVLALGKEIPFGLDSTSRFDTILPLNNSSFVDTTRTSTGLYATVFTKDNKGCQTDTFVYFRNEIMTKNKFVLRGRCINDDSTGLSYASLNFQDPYGVMYNTYSKWEIFGDTVIRGGVSGIQARFKKSGANKIRLTVYNIDSTCSVPFDSTLYILPAPKADFTANPVCYESTTNFISISLPASPGDSIISYRWKLTSIDTISNTPNTAFKYPTAGDYYVTLYITNNKVNQSYCTDSIRKKVTVLPKPKADFYIATALNDQQTGIPIDFVDKTSSLDNITTWKWKFTVKDSLTLQAKADQSFTFDSIGVFSVRQIVMNNVGCPDTLVQRLDLNAYLILPSAFSPNGDGENDELYLLYKGIKSLKEFNIYNRFGEKVFEAGQNLNAKWTGTQHNVPSPVGAYVFYVSANTVYGKDVYLSGQVTLLR